MNDNGTVADPLRVKRSHPLSGDADDAEVLTSSAEAGQAGKRVKLEDSETFSQQLPQAVAHVGPVNTEPQQLAVKQEDNALIVANATTVDPISAAAASAVISEPANGNSSTASEAKPAASSSDPQTLPPSTLQQSARQPLTQTQTAPPLHAAAAAPSSAAPVSVTTTAACTTTVPRKESPLPLKALTFHHLHKKYGPELEYMLVEFKKLERQLLGAPIHQQQNPPKAEPKGSRERREKLHGFILHLEDTIRQVEEGCALEKREEGSIDQVVHGATGSLANNQQEETEEEEKKSSDASLQQPQHTAQTNTASNLNNLNKTTSNMEGPPKKFTAAEAALSSLPPEKEREESVQRLEEHILANLLPVKVRLTKQLAAQKGATRNPVTAPVRAGAANTVAGGTIAEAVEAKRRAQEEELLKKQLQQRQISTSQYGKPIGGAGSSLTARLHGGVLGSNAPAAGASGSETTKRPILYAGVAPGSSQVPSTIKTVSGAHPGLIGKDATKAVALAEEERRRLKNLEENATRVAFGVATKPSPAASALDPRKPAALPSLNAATLPKQPEGPATLAARARAVALAAASSGGAASKISRPNQQFPTRSLQQHHVKKGPPVTAAPAATIAAPRAPHINQYTKPSAAVPYHSVPTPPMTAKSKKPHIAPNFDDPSLTPEQRFELRLKEARWRQRKRRRERRRRRLEGYLHAAGAYHVVPSAVQQQPSLSLSSQPHLQETQPERVASTTFTPNAPAPPPPVNTPPPPVTSASRPKKNGAYGPRTVEYVCAVCNETYMSTCEFNPWWALTSHDCPKCGKPQIPKLDISTPANEIDYHPALLSQEDNAKPQSSSVSASANASNPAVAAPQLAQPIQYMPKPPAHMKKNFFLSDSEVSLTDESDGEGGGGKYDESSEEEDTSFDNDMDSVTREERAEKEEFGFDYKGEVLSEDQARRLLVLIEHASICPGRHRSAKHRNVCHSTKYMMLHVRDCCGLLSNGDVCPFPWCRKTKHLLYHLVTCTKNDDGSKCSICCPENLSSNLMDLVGLNSYRRKIFVERAKAVAAAAAATRHQMAIAKAKAAAQSSTQPHVLTSSQILTAPSTNHNYESQTKPFATASTHVATHATQPLGNARRGSSVQDATTASNNTGPHLDSEVVL
ncbi:hypothetical protein HJC23_003603 [Cyclotella cryptica]|uniref:TAZ-type domain-containing protein n=1 Tax=Cyclotella cryptica TaxID=29204 RepID=A0ABD3QIP6_9STRA|eukprot:CCRYP_004887-RA/>CCRYP_004887-RA protein AED:0.01 eAED:0.01 QI:247/1/1/1/1/1/2/75/1141